MNTKYNQVPNVQQPFVIELTNEQKKKQLNKESNDFFKFIIIFFILGASSFAFPIIYCVTAISISAIFKETSFIIAIFPTILAGVFVIYLMAKIIKAK